MQQEFDSPTDLNCRFNCKLNDLQYERRYVECKDICSNESWRMDLRSTMKLKVLNYVLLQVNFKKTYGCLVLAEDTHCNSKKLNDKAPDLESWHAGLMSATPYLVFQEEWVVLTYSS